jgi:hypothetical protein
MPQYPKIINKDNISSFFSEYAKENSKDVYKLIYVTTELLKTIEQQYKSTNYRTFSISSILKDTLKRINPTGLVDMTRAKQINKSTVKICLFWLVDYDLCDFATKKLDRNHNFSSNPKTKNSRYVFWLTIKADKIATKNIKPSKKYSWITDLIFQKQTEEKKDLIIEKPRINKQMNLFNHREKVVLITDINGTKTWARYEAETLDLIALMPSKIKTMEIIQIDKDSK